MRIPIKILLTFIVLLIGLIGGGIWPYLPSWIGIKFSLLMLAVSGYTIYRIWKKKPKEIVPKEDGSSLNDKTS